MSSRTYSSLCRVALQSAERLEGPFRLQSVLGVQAVEDGIELSTPSETVQRDQGHNWIGIDANATGRDSQIFFPEKFWGRGSFLSKTIPEEPKMQAGRDLRIFHFFLVPVTTSHRLDLLGCRSYSRL